MFVSANPTIVALNVVLHLLQAVLEYRRVESSTASQQDSKGRLHTTWEFRREQPFTRVPSQL